MGAFVLPLCMSWELLRFLVYQILYFGTAVTHRFAIERTDEVYRLSGLGTTGKVVFVWE